MGSFVFKWTHPASEVYVTGTFEEPEWSKSEKLEKVGDIFEKNVTLPSASEKIYYKFVVDGTWTTDHTAPQENDASGNLNNVLTTDRIIKHTQTPETAGIMSGVTPTSTTAALAKDVPLEKSGSSDLPGTFPETPAAVEKGDFSVNPLPATEGAINPITSAPVEKSIHSAVTTDKESYENSGALGTSDEAKASEPTFGVSPLPAFAGAVNPITSTPGGKIPDSSDLTANTVYSAVTTDKESYEKSGGLGNAPVLPPVDANGNGSLDLPPISKNLIPESSLPMGAAGIGTFDASPTIQSSGPTSTTAALAANVPLESTKVPEIVKESQDAAGVDAEASGIPAEVKEKSDVEKELLKEVPEAPSTSEGTAGKGTDKSEKPVAPAEVAGAVGGAAVAIGGAAYAYASDAASKLPPSVTSKIPDTSSLPASVTSKLPESIQNSINSINAKSSLPTTTAKDTPEVVKESIAESGQSPEAASNEEAVLEKKAMEKQLLSEIKPETSTGEAAPKIAAAKETLTPPAVTSKPESRDVSPMTVPGSHSQAAPLVTSGVDSTTAPSKSTGGPSTPSKVTDSPASSTVTDKKKKRASFFGKLKAKLSHKDKE